MKLYFVDVKFSLHGHRHGYIFLTLEEAVNSIIETICDGEEDQLEEIKEAVDKFLISPNKEVSRLHMYGDGKIIGAGHIYGFDVVILELQLGDKINLE